MVSYTQNIGGEGTSANHDFYTWQSWFFKETGFPEQELKEFITTRPAYKKS